MAVKLYKMSRQEAYNAGRMEGRKEGRDFGFQTGLYYALAGYYNTKPDDIVSDKEFGEWSKRAEDECRRIFNDDTLRDIDLSKKAILTDEDKKKETMEERTERILRAIDRLRTDVLDMEAL